MGYLWGVTLLWAFSFSLIGVYLAGQVDSYFAVLTRALLAAAMFLPLLRWRQVSAELALKMMAIGGLQLGVMYLCLYQSFIYLSVPEVLLFTILTPLYITLLNDVMQRRFSLVYLVTAALAVLGAGIIRYHQVSADFLGGFLLVQGANLCFAIGQISYKQLMAKREERLHQHTVFGFFYLGACVVAAAGFGLFGNPDRLPTTALQWGILLWLGLVASALGYFFWNKGATQVDAGALAIMNNALVPAGLIVNLVIWDRDADLLRLSLGGAVILLSLGCNHYWTRRRQRLASAAM
ncbi:hypothetical protein BFW38_03505 [Terasakiispira papahanaumokuakeensis]|uniref:EamA domain-containing protein n=1 Tax=Terasakiispira papahanaumokuakeensis TaxID=197479 RepID=A0A1E2V7C7_9GAMM|nr:carboxylate/amino acid/amine transporter [Terasakiispira papahanaumokuakeensis]ODC02752.1 hypothetical protein BFW38_03505 [Terasakiispira papahanaumokuakeensis]